MRIPPGFTRLFPYILVTRAKDYLEFLADGLGGEIVSVNASSDGMVLNAHVRFGDTTLMVSEATADRRASRGTCYLYVDDADAAMRRALAAGGTMVSEVRDQAYGDRQGGVSDPAGNVWWLSQRVVDGPYG
jgi:PhnB protein